MNMDTITLNECILYAIQGVFAIINDGKLIGFEQEEIPVKDGNHDGD